MRRRLFVTAVIAGAVLVGSALPAAAQHTNPREPQSPLEDPGSTQLLTKGAGTWKHIRNFPPNPGTDIKFFRKKGRLYAVSGSLGQGDTQGQGNTGVAVGQRIIRLVNKRGKVKPRWVADHGSAACTPDNSSATSLQHDQVVLPKRNPRVLVDTTDVGGRCHDPDGGGLEIVDISKIHKKKWKPREIHLTRHAGTSHTVTADATRPWILYNSASQSSGMPWIDVLNVRSCIKKGLSKKARRASCRPKVYRINLQDAWTQRIDTNGDRVPGTESSCHDITAKAGRIYCANLNSTIVLDVRNLTKPNGAVRGTPLNCEIADGTDTKAKVTDCDDPATVGNGEARGWKYIGHVNHPGRNGSHNTNDEVESTEGVAVSHEAEPTPDKKFMFVTDERGGGVVPGGASCAPGVPNPYGNGGVHVFKLGNGGEFKYAKTPSGDKAVFIGEPQVPAPTFCTAHVMEQLRNEQRFTIAWYSQGTKIVDWFTNANDRFTFRETAAVVPQNPPATTWTTLVFKTKKHNDGRRTYWIMASDISRGIDIMKWTGRPNKLGTRPPGGPATSPVSDSSPSEGTPDRALAIGFLAAAFLGPLARRRRR